MGRGCTTALPETTPTVPPTPFPTPPTPPPTLPVTQPPTRPPAPSGPVDPFNCAVDPENTWAADKKAWCCRIHHVGCPPTAPPPQPIMPAPQPIVMPAPQPVTPADPYNCADGFANWQAGLPQDRQHPADLWIPSTALLILRTRGPSIRRLGAV